MTFGRLVLVALLAASCSLSTQPPTVRVQPAVPPAWLMFRGDPARDGHPLGATLTPEAAARLRPAWTAELGSPVASGPVVAGGMLYAGTMDGTLVALSTEDGKPAWKATGLEPLSGQLLVAGGSLYAGSVEGRLYAFDAESGTEVWDWRAPGAEPEIAGGPVLDRGLLLVGIGGGSSEAGRLVALDPASGDRIWATCLSEGCKPGDAVDSSIALDPSGYGFVGVESPDGAVASFDAGIGRLRWRSPLAEGVVATPLLFLSRGGQERVAAARVGGNFSVLEAGTGKVIWNRNLVGGVGAAAFDGHAFYVPVGSVPGGLMALAPDDGSVMWAESSTGLVASEPAAGLGVVVYGEVRPDGTGGAVVAVAAATGRELWRAQTGSAVTASPALVGENVFTADRAGQVLAFRPSG